MLLLDEPLGALDPMIRAGLQRDLKEVFARTGATVLLVTHDLVEASRFADRVCVLECGTDRAAGSVRRDRRAAGQRLRSRVRQLAGGRQLKHRSDCQMGRACRRAVGGGLAPLPRRAAQVRIGSKKFTESVILGEMLRLLAARSTGSTRSTIANSAARGSCSTPSKPARSMSTRNTPARSSQKFSPASMSRTKRPCPRTCYAHRESACRSRWASATPTHWR